MILVMSLLGSDLKQNLKRLYPTSMRRLVAVYLRWFSAIKKQCAIDPNVVVTLEVLALEIELDHLSYGRFQEWMKEK